MKIPGIDTHGLVVGHGPSTRLVICAWIGITGRPIEATLPVGALVLVERGRDLPPPRHR